MRNDSKAKLISEEGKKIGFEIIGSNFSRNILFFIFLILQMLRFKKPKAVIVRYLNDHRSFLRSILLASNVLLTILLCIIFKIKILWFLHNIDRETSEYYPFIIKFTRAIVGRFSQTIFVTDPLLVKFAANKYPKWKDKIDFITFGKRNVEDDIQTDYELISILKSLIDFRKSGGLVFFCPTSAGDKYTHINNAPKLMATAKKLGFNYKLIIVGEMTNYLNKNLKLKELIDNSDDIIIINRFVTYNSSKIAPFIDAYLRSLSDQSISFTLYEAASIKKPVLTLNHGFIGYAVQHYNLGAVLSLDMKNLYDCHKKILSWNSNFAINFLNNHSWEIAAIKIKNSLFKNA